jgi:hypothetical protein
MTRRATAAWIRAQGYYLHYELGTHVRVGRSRYCVLRPYADGEPRVVAEHTLATVGYCDTLQAARRMVERDQRRRAA